MKISNSLTVITGTVAVPEGGVRHVLENTVHTPDHCSLSNSAVALMKSQNSKNPRVPSAHGEKKNLAVLRKKNVAKQPSLGYPQFVVTGGFDDKVRTVLERVVRGLDLKKSTVQIVESILLVFMARTSYSKKVRSPKEQHRFENSMRQTAINIKAAETIDGGEQSYVKFWLDSMAVRLFSDNVFPEPSGPNVNLFQGYCWTYIKRALNARDVRFIYSLQKGCKQMWPDLPYEKLVQAYKKHAVRLTLPQVPLTPDQINALERASGLVFRTEVTGMADKDRHRVRGFQSLYQKGQLKLLPSAHACVEKKYGEGAISLFTPFDPLKIKCDGFNFLDDSDLYDQNPLPVMKQLIYDVNGWRQTVMNECVDDIDENLFCCEAIGLFEPGKIRMISKGPGRAYTALQPLQGELLSMWKRTKWSTMLHDDLTIKVNELVRPEFHDFYWFSADYEAATDLLKREVTIRLLEKHFTHPLYPIALATLGSITMKYPKVSIALDAKEPKKKTTLMESFDVKSTAGQLMGHPLSFPLLCVSNLAVLLITIDEWILEGTWKSFHERKVVSRLIVDTAIINGDDLLYRGPKEIGAMFSKNSLAFGLKPSQGKNYCSPDTCQINSQLFQMRKGTMVKFNYLNTRFLRKSSELNTGVAMAKAINPMLLDVPWTRVLVPDLMSKFSKPYEKLQFQPNWYLPIHLGGFGLNPLVSDKPVEVTHNQRLMATYFLHNPKLQWAVVNNQKYTGQKALDALFGKLVLNPTMMKESEFLFYGLDKPVKDRDPENVPEQYMEMVECDVDEWGILLAYVARISQNFTEGLGDPILRIALQRKEQKDVKTKSGRLTAMLDSTIEEYRHVRYVSIPRPPVPPLDLNLNRVRRDVLVNVLAARNSPTHIDDYLNLTVEAKDFYALEHFVRDSTERIFDMKQYE